MLTTLPITREEFEKMVNVACDGAGVPMGEDSIIAAINYFHSLDRDECKFDPDILSNYLRRAYSNQMTFDYTTEIRHKREAERAEKMAEGQPATPTLVPVANSAEH
jgi:hypothetical protein